jgi:ABC-type dipeptide/oligopeptide/nickel transport system permease subunit
MIGFAIGVALAPRMAWAVESLWESAPPERSLQWRLGGTLLVIFTAAMFATFQYSVLICFMGLGVQHPVASLGNMLASHLDILGGTAVVDDARFYILATAVSGATAVFAWALYLLQDALADYFGFRRKSFLPRVLS